MQYRKPQYYDTFACVADKCPDTCCAGWQIMIDEDSLERYGEVEGGFGVRLLNSIDWSEGSFEQCNKRCSFLNEENLCDIYRELGADALCDTCRMYPRHVEEFENLRELSLSLSCPIAARMILGCKEPVKFTEETDELEECEEDYEDFDFLLFARLEEARNLLFKITKDRSRSISQRMFFLLKLSELFQKALDEGSLFSLDLNGEYASLMSGACCTKESVTPETMVSKKKKMLKDLQKLEVLREEWRESLKELEKNLNTKEAESYAQKRAAFSAYTEEKFGKEQWEIYKEQLLMFFLYTYFCGAVYDDMVYTKTVLAVFSVGWIEEVIFAKWLKNGKNIEFQDVVTAAYQYAREIEHSDENLIMLEEIYDGNFLYSPESLAEVF